MSAPYWTDQGRSCDRCGEHTRRRCGCGAVLCVDCGDQPHTHGEAS